MRWSRLRSPDEAGQGVLGDSRGCASWKTRTRRASSWSRTSKRRRTPTARTKQSGKARRLRAVIGMRDRVLHQVEIVRLEDAGEEMAWRPGARADHHREGPGTADRRRDPLKLDEDEDDDGGETGREAESTTDEHDDRSKRNQFLTCVHPCSSGVNSRAVHAEPRHASPAVFRRGGPDGRSADRGRHLQRHAHAQRRLSGSDLSAHRRRRQGPGLGRDQHGGQGHAAAGGGGQHGHRRRRRSAPRPFAAAARSRSTFRPAPTCGGPRR